MTSEPMGKHEGLEGRDGEGLALDAEGVDAELAALPPPPRGEKRWTLVLLAATFVSCLGMAWSLRGDAAYAVVAESVDGGTPVPLASLAATAARSAAATSWAGQYACAQGMLGAAGAVRFERPFEAGSFRLSPAMGRDDVWVELRLADGAEGGRYAPPTSFCGRLVRLDAAGPRRRGLASAVAAATGKEPPPGAWLLVDGEPPRASRWACALMAAFIAFALWSGVTLARLAGPAPEGR